MGSVFDEKALGVIPVVGCEDHNFRVLWLLIRLLESIAIFSFAGPLRALTSIRVTTRCDVKIVQAGRRANK